jgi:gliding motility-associated-like protein
LKLKHIYILVTVLCCLIFSSHANAKHIIGGEITYICNGNDSYSFTMYVYRDCSSDGAPYDTPAHFAIYSQIGASYTRVRELMVNISGGTPEIAPPEDPCLIPPDNICVQQARYNFTANLPAINGSYHIVYQRCCRNNTINNIVDPEDAGATYTVEITPEAQQACNNTPVYNDFPPIIICVNNPLFFDHSATDPDGDQLVYEFCAPLLGGGPFGTSENPGDASACDGVMPIYPCAPPFDPVLYILPTYSALNPMGGAPQINIDPNTGFISGTPTILGQFVVGVCVSEYRNGILLSTVRRDFQFNVTSCQPIVDARVAYDEIINAQEFVINSCGNNTITFENNSIQESNIDQFFWNFTIEDSLQTFTEWNPTVTFPDIGSYQGMLVLNPGLDCGDTAFINVNVYPDIGADFSFDYDTCVAGPVTFTDLSYSDIGPDGITDWFWDFDLGQQGTSDEQNPVYMLNSPGNIPVALTVTDSNGCQDIETQIVPWFPAPPILIIEPSNFNGCVPMEVFFNNLSIPIDSTYDIVWDFGDGITSGDVSPTHIYTEPGNYSISLQVTSPIGCYIEDSWANWIVAKPSPIADFIYAPDEVNSFDPTVTFTDLSFEPSFWFWNFDGEGISNDQSPVFTFADTGRQEVMLIVTHESGCMDTLIQFIDIIPKVTFFMPNAFTPNNDGINDFFQGNGITEGMDNFTMSIWNRYGELIFETNNPKDSWNGRKRNTGRDSPNGVYVYIVNYTGPRKNNFELKGYATLIR